VSAPGRAGGSVWGFSWGCQPSLAAWLPGAVCFHWHGHGSGLYPGGSERHPPHWGGSVAGHALPLPRCPHVPALPKENLLRNLLLLRNKQRNKTNLSLLKP